MADIFKFQQQDEHQEECCEVCDTINDYLHIALECESGDELEIALRGLFDDAFDIGYRSAIEADIEIKQQILSELHNNTELD